MVKMRNLALAASSLIGLSSAAPALASRQSYTPGTLNNTQEFYISMHITDGTLNTTYEGWQIETYHTGAGLADPVFAPTGSRAFLNGTNLQFDVDAYPFSANGIPSDTNYARWEPVTITSGYGNGVWVNEESAGLRVDNPESDGWIVCEWSHGTNAPQLFQMIHGFDGEGVLPYEVPSSCARVVLFPVWI